MDYPAVIFVPPTEGAAGLSGCGSCGCGGNCGGCGNGHTCGCGGLGNPVATSLQPLALAGLVVLGALLISVAFGGEEAQWPR